MSTRPQGKQGPRIGPKGGVDDEITPVQGRQPRPGGGQRQSMMETIIKAFIRSIASSIGRTIARTITRRMR